MIFLLALTSILVMLPLTVLVCIKREKRDKLAFSAEVTHTNKVSESTPPAAKPPPLPPQPHSDGTTQKDTATSTTKKEETDKQAATVTVSRGRIVRSRTRTPRLESSEFGASRRDREASTRKWSPRIHYLEPPAMPSAGRRRSPELAAKREVARTPGGQRRVSPQGCSAATGPLSKLSRKSRKASQPRSPSMKEFPMKPRIAQSKTDLTALASVKNVDGNKSAQTALSEYVFEEGKYKLLGKVDQVIGQSDETDVLNKALVTEQSRTCESVTNPARSPFFDGQFDVWIADRVGSQAEG
ncbi:hypothetical protein PRIPAC_74068 [Pristionchus pacificus]|uniref:Uncharacterized protein n=1 Tax=Pristionchus pacificus TaxID=54126 RepID=A0A2A6C723_PRIPA|nr:hypothetical protein PRIPAC_74068 [Pristionchus pacificus]|eukprot:PDM73984.1 hypothetical protein PRIPAC_41340 [Pristionchus pacificus]